MRIMTSGVSGYYPNGYFYCDDLIDAQSFQLDLLLKAVQSFSNDFLFANDVVDAHSFRNDLLLETELFKVVKYFANEIWSNKGVVPDDSFRNGLLLIAVQSFLNGLVEADGADSTLR